MSLPLLRQCIRVLFAVYLGLLTYWVYQHSNPDGNWFLIALFQTAPLLLIAPVFISFKSQHLHLALPVVMIYLCFTAPNLYLSWPDNSIAIAELIVNLGLSSLIMWYMLKVSKLKRLENTRINAPETA